MGDLTGSSAAAKKEAEAQRAEIKKQRQLEERKLAEEEGDIARRKAAMTAGRSGRSLLVSSQQQGTKTKLGA